jgi:solute carrier family 25 citrate transporter 1
MNSCIGTTTILTWRLK